MNQKPSRLLFCVLSIFCPALAAVADTDNTHSDQSSHISVIPAPEVQWSPLNPARGDKGPMAGALWGDRTGAGASGFLVRFRDGFSSPPHIHNITYRGVVIDGQIHNDDPQAANLWLTPGSYWTQPRGDNHITAARGQNSLAYIEIDQGPYLVLPSTQAFETEEVPLNVDQSNLVWLDASSMTWINSPGSASARISFLWGKPVAGQLNGSLLRLPAGFNGTLVHPGPDIRVIVIAGSVTHQTDLSGQHLLEPGSYFGAEQSAAHRIRTEADKESLLFIRSTGSYSVSSE